MNAPPEHLARPERVTLRTHRALHPDQVWHLIVQLLPEMVGLAITPAAIIATFVLLGSSRPWRNVALFGGAFLLTYCVISVIAWAIGGGTGPSSDGNALVRGEISIVLGLLFVAGGALSWWHARKATPDQAPPEPPAWLRRLEDPPWKLVVGAGLFLSVVNPNVAILASGLSITFTADVSTSQQLVAVLLLLASSMTDFVVPAVAFAITGPGGRAKLRAATRWLIRHNQQIGTGVLLAFGLLFVARGLATVLG